MAKKKRARRQQPRRETGAATAERPAAGATKARALPEWRWRTFPVFAAFIAGLLIASFINGRPDNGVAAAVQIVALLGLGYVLAHLVVTNVIVAGRIKRRNEAAARGEAPPEDYEEELVYPDEDEESRDGA